MNTSKDCKEIKLIKMLEASRRFIENKHSEIDFQYICDDMLEISGARYVGFNLFDQEGRSYSTLAFSGVNNDYGRITDMLGFDPQSVKWSTEDDKYKLIDNYNLVEFNSLHELTGDVIPEALVIRLEKEFHLGQIVVIRITKDQKIMGDFTLFMSADEKFSNHQLVELFASQVGLFIEKFRAEQQIINSDEKFREIVEGSYDIVYRLTSSGLIEYLSPAWEKLLGHHIEDAIGKSFHPYVHPDDLPLLIEYFDKVSITGKRLEIEQYRLKHRDGSWHWYDTNSISIKDEAGKIIGFIGTAKDITVRKQIAEQLQKEKELFRTTLLSVGDGVIATDENSRVAIMNPIAEKLTGRSADKSIGMLFDDIFPVFHEKNRRPCTGLSEQVIKTCRTLEFDQMLLYKYGINGEKLEIPIELGASPILNHNGQTSGAVVVFRDYTEKREKQIQVEYLSFHDQLTGLYNRRYLEDSITRLNTKRNLPLAAIVLDVNGLKLTNDAFGHVMGDLLLCKTADILNKVLRSDDIICRSGGDEFTILLPETDLNTAEEVIARINDAASREDLKTIKVSVAAGCAVKTDVNQLMSDVIKDADSAMYRHKLVSSKIMRTQTVKLIMHTLHSELEVERRHTEHVSQYCERIAIALQLDQKQITEAAIAGSLHDIGKIAVPIEIILKPGPLNHEEMETIRRHSITGYQILRSVDEYSGLAEYIFHHHEFYDGSGYPEGLKGNSIPLVSRIISIADAYEAMTSPRVYREKRSRREALKELSRCAGSQFDPEIVKIFTDLELADIIGEMPYDLPN